MNPMLEMFFTFKSKIPQLFIWINRIGIQLSNVLYHKKHCVIETQKHKSNFLKTNSKHINVKDDTTVYVSGRDFKALCEDVCEELNKVDEWLKANRLFLNIDKTYFMIHTHLILRRHVTSSDMPALSSRYCERLNRAYSNQSILISFKIDLLFKI